MVECLPIMPFFITDSTDGDLVAKMKETGLTFEVPSSGYMSALLAVVPLQRIAYDVTVGLGYDPDRPRNLAKELTTK